MSGCACFRILSPPWLGESLETSHTHRSPLGPPDVVLLALIVPSGCCLQEMRGPGNWFSDMLKHLLGPAGDRPRDMEVRCAHLSDIVNKDMAGTRPDSARPALADPADCRLTPHEVRLLKLLVQGHRYKTAAAELGVSSHTVSFHLRRLYQKLDVHSKSEAVSKALRHGLV